MQNSNQHRPNDFTPVTGAMDLADYVINITDNINNFPDFIHTERKNPDGTISEVFIQRQDSLIQIVRDQTLRIFLLTFSANEINLTREPWRKAERLEKQADAIRLCGEHIASIQLCRKHFHLLVQCLFLFFDKLYRMAQLVKSGAMTREKFNECYTSWKAHAKLGNSYKLLQRMDGYVKSLFMEVNNGERTE